MKKRVVVTGMGCLTPLGNDMASTWCGLKEGRSGVGPITRFDPSRITSRIAGELKGFDPVAVMHPKEARRMDRFQQIAFAAAAQALEHSRYEITPENAPRIGVLVGSGIGGLGTLSDQFKVLFERGPSRISPFLITMMVVDLAPGLISILLGAKGPNFSTVSACASGAHAVGEAAEIIRRGQADLMLAGGSESGIVEIGFAGFCSMRALSTHNDEPERASRPFDVGRDGFILSEGAGMLLLEDYEHARERDADIYAEIIGYGSSADSSHITDPAPGGEGAARAMTMAIQQAGIQPGEIGYINAHGTSTQAGDLAETDAIKSVFGKDAYRIPVSSTKSMMGHTLGAAGAIESVISILAMREGCLPPTINLEEPGPGCDLDYVPNKARPAQIDTVMSNSFGFGGHNVSLIFHEAH